VYGSEIGLSLQQRRDFRPGCFDALCAIDIVGGRYRESRFPPGRRIKPVIGRKQTLQQGRPGARQAENHDHRRQLLLEYLRMTMEPVTCAQPSRQRVEEPRAPHLHTR
jgi:hypothetical protein